MLAKIGAITQFRRTISEHQGSGAWWGEHSCASDTPFYTLDSYTFYTYTPFTLQARDAQNPRNSRQHFRDCTRD